MSLPINLAPCTGFIVGVDVVRNFARIQVDDEYNKPDIFVGGSSFYKLLMGSSTAKGTRVTIHYYPDASRIYVHDVFMPGDIPPRIRSDGTVAKDNAFNYKDLTDP